MKPIFKTPSDADYFFGYYDKSALSSDAKMLLAQKAPFIDRMPNGNDSLIIGYFDLDDNLNTFNVITSTKAWNWQQGCMLQWLGPDFSTKIIYNDIFDNKFVSVIYDISTHNKTRLDMAIYSVSRCGKLALCVDHEILSWIRPGYSYQGVKVQDKNKPVMPADGIWLLHIDTGELTKIIDLKTLMQIRPHKDMSDATHYVEHVLFNRNGNRFQFLHRWKLNDGGIFTRLYTADIDGSRLHLLNDSGRVTHCCWLNNEQVLGWAAVNNNLNRLRRYKILSKYFFKPLLPLYRRLARGDSIKGNSKVSGALTGDGYLLMDDMTSTSVKFPVHLLGRDGHPSNVPGYHDWFVTDTYPDEHGFLDLLLCNFSSKKIILIDKLKSMKKYDSSQLRCDLHPKISYDGKYVAIDTMNDGCRGIYLYDISNHLDISSHTH